MSLMGMDFIQDAKEHTKNRQNSANGKGFAGGTESTNILGQVADTYKPAMDRLKEQQGSTELVDRAQDTSQDRFDRGVQAAGHMNAATGGLTTRQAALGKYQATRAGSANMDASVNMARLQQDELKQEATSGLAGIQRSLLNTQMEEARHGERLEMQREQHQDRMRQAELDREANEPGFFGKVFSLFG